LDGRLAGSDRRPAAWIRRRWAECRKHAEVPFARGRGTDRQLDVTVAQERARTNTRIGCGAGTGAVGHANAVLEDGDRVLVLAGRNTGRVDAEDDDERVRRRCVRGRDVDLLAEERVTTRRRAGRRLLGKDHLAAVR